MSSYIGLLFLLEQKKTTEENALKKKLLKDQTFLEELFKNNKNTPMNIPFALLKAGASIEETKKVTEAWKEEENQRDSILHNMERGLIDETIASKIAVPVEVFEKLCQQLSHKVMISV